MRLLSIPLLIVCAALGCDDKADPVPSGSGSDSESDSGTTTEGQSTDETTYSEHIKPILDSRCISCHSSEKGGAGRNGAPVGLDFNTYQAAKASASEGNGEIQSGGMPPSGAIPTDEKQTFQDWVDDGLLE